MVDSRIIVAISLLVTIIGARVAPSDGPDRDMHPHGAPSSSPQQQTVDWYGRGQADLTKTLNLVPRWSQARNVILFVGDGLGVSTMTAARFLKSQRTGTAVVDTALSWENAPYSGLIKTYNTDSQTPDSAGTATALFCGEKAREGVVGVNQNVIRANCSTVQGNEIPSIISHGMTSGKWAGVVTTTRITHATPASAYAHSADRDWEDDSDVRAADQDPEECWDIARQLVHDEQNKNIRVILGGGRRNFFPNGTVHPENPTDFGRRLDGRDLTEDWKSFKREMGVAEGNFAYVERKQEFDAVDVNSIEYLMGLFEDTHMKYEADRLDETDTDEWTEPSFAEMVKKSLDILKRGPDGFVLVAEGGRIDHAHHDTNAYRALQDTLAMDEAVAVAMAETSEDDTLIVVTADHSHVFTMGGYQAIDNDIFGFSIYTGDDDKPYTTLSYANGPGWYNHRNNVTHEEPRLNLSEVVTYGRDFLQDTPVPLYSEAHGAEDVAVYARGPMSHAFVGLHEQHYIAHAAMYASCLGPNKGLCEGQTFPAVCVSAAGSLGVTAAHVLAAVILALGAVLSA